MKGKAPFKSQGRKKRPLKKSTRKKVKVQFKATPKETLENEIRLNRFIALSGLCSRREADKLIANGVVEVNGKIVKELGYKINPHKDIVKVRGRKIKPEPNVYILLNKPKNTITTVKDPKNRKTVINLIEGATNLRVYPVGRLDRNTTGVLLLTNDGDLARKLTHPSYNIKKVYEVTTYEEITQSDLDRLVKGVELEDGFFKPDNVYKADKDKVVLEIHSGKNRIIRRYFDKLGLKIKKLDRVEFAGLTKKGAPRGKWRFLTPREVGYLKMITGDKRKSK